MQCKQAHEYAQIKCKQSMFMSLLPLLVCFSCSRILIHLFFLNVAPSWSMSLFDLSFETYLLLSNLPHDHIFVPTSPPLSSIFIKGMIPIKSIDTNWKGVNLIVTKDCIGIDGWGLNLAFFMDITMCWNDITWIALEIPLRIFDLDTIWWGTPLCHSMGHSLVNLVGEGTFFAWWSLKVEDHLWNHLLVW